MGRHAWFGCGGLARLAAAWVAAVALGAPAGVVRAVPLDQSGEMRLGLRTYTGVRIGTEQTDVSIEERTGGLVLRSLTFPSSAAGHVRQLRLFAQAELRHDLTRLLREDFGPLSLLNQLPFGLRSLRYHLEYRGEGEGIYDFGPREFRTAEQFRDPRLVLQFPPPPAPKGLRKRLRRIGVERQRLFQAFVEAEAGRAFLRVGRQILAWGETDGFRLLDNINPLDSSFGGFLVSLDERRVPIDMLRTSYYLGHLGPISEAFVETYAAVDDRVSFIPGTPQGSPWSLPNLGTPSAVVHSIAKGPRRSIPDVRGGVQFKFVAPVPGLGTESTFGVAHYYTYVDIPSVEVFVDPRFPLALREGPGKDFLALAVQRAPRVQVTGGSSSFTVPARLARRLGLTGEPVIRTEVAYLRREPRFSQGQLDPFIFKLTGNPDAVTAGRRTGDSWNFVLGLDANQFVRSLNARQTLFISTQFFFKHLNGAARRQPVTSPRGCTPGSRGCRVIATDGEVLPVPEVVRTQPGLIQPLFIHHPVNQYLQTLLIATSYASGQISPNLTAFYDWSGGLVLVPAVTLSRDPFRFAVGYSYLHASRLRGASGVSLLRDRDNVLFQLEYVL